MGNLKDRPAGEGELQGGNVWLQEMCRSGQLEAESLESCPF